MIRPAVITDEITQEFERSLDVMLEYEVREAELRGLWGTNIMDLSPEQMERARGALLERGIRVCGLATPIYKCHLDAQDGGGLEGPMHLAVERSLDQQLTLLERAIDLARYFDTNLIRIFAFWRKGELTEELTSRIVEALRPAVRRAEEAGVILGLENEHACMLGTGKETAPVLRAIESPALRCVWDPGNASMGEELPYPDGYREVAPYVVHVHVKDNVTNADGKKVWTVVGQGEIDFRGQIQGLLEDGYEGLLSLETHYKPASGDTEEGSRECLAGMIRLMKETGALA
jgi:sugar phosphate isomerase/epimerase